MSRIIPLLLLSLVSFLSCKKKVDSPPNNNEIKATIRYKSGQQVDIYVTGSKAVMGKCGILGGGWHANALDDSGGSLYLSAGRCIDSAGHYNNVHVMYFPNGKLHSSPMYENYIIPIPGGPTSLSIFTFKEVRKDYVDGAFSSMAWYQKDTVLITGTFKGDHFE